MATMQTVEYLFDKFESLYGHTWLSQPQIKKGHVEAYKSIWLGVISDMDLNAVRTSLRALNSTFKTFPPNPIQFLDLSKESGSKLPPNQQSLKKPNGVKSSPSGQEYYPPSHPKYNHYGFLPGETTLNGFKRWIAIGRGKHVPESFKSEIFNENKKDSL